MTVYKTQVTITGGLGAEAMKGKVDHPGALVLRDLSQRVSTEFSPTVQKATMGDPAMSGSPSRLVVDLYFEAANEDEARRVAEAAFEAEPLPGSSYTITWTPPRTP